MQADFLSNNVATRTPINPLALGHEELADLCSALGEKAAHAKSLIKYIHRLGVCDYAKMHDLKVALRDKLASVSAWEFPTIVNEQRASDGTYKWLLRLKDGNTIETVLIPEKCRNTLCISTQVGCALNCAFCATARQGFKRNLDCGEIVAQLWLVNRRLRAAAEAEVSNVVFMGMGEPLLNFDAVIQAASLMTDDLAYGIPGRRVTVSTSGYVPGILRLKAVPNVALTVSLHAPTDSLRDRLVPINRKYPIAVLFDAVRQFLDARGSNTSLTFGYVMLKDVNDTVSCAMELARLIKGMPAKVNLIPFNDFAQSGFSCSDAETLSRFRSILYEHGIVTTVRRSRGSDIAAACGQLSASYKNDNLNDNTSVNQRIYMG